VRQRSHRLEIIWCSNDVGHPRLGIIIPRFGHSVVRRNRLRRRLREYARRRVLRGLPGGDLVIRARPPAYAAHSVALAADLERWRSTLRA
jgi:ribonuclease P protein component